MRRFTRRKFSGNLCKVLKGRNPEDHKIKQPSHIRVQLSNYIVKNFNRVTFKKKNELRSSQCSKMWKICSGYFAVGFALGSEPSF